MENSITSKKKRIRDLLKNPLTKKDRQDVVRLLVKFKKNQNKLAYHSQKLSDSLLKINPYTLMLMKCHFIDCGRDPEEAMNHLIGSTSIFHEQLVACRKAIKAARKRVKNKDYKDE